LQKYLEQVGKLLVEKRLHRARPGDGLSAIVRAQTAAALEGLDPIRKGMLLLFLYDARLIRKDKPVVSLSLVDFRRADLSAAFLHQADLSGASLDKADLRGALLVDADLRGAQLTEANLSQSFLRAVDLTGANLTGADLSEAEGITNEKLEQQAISLQGAIMPDGSKHP
jgi:uncharacterized protein YjbI with pentapeptide repeats